MYPQPVSCMTAHFVDRGTTYAGLGIVMFMYVIYHASLLTLISVFTAALPLTGLSLMHCCGNLCRFCRQRQMRLLVKHYKDTCTEPSTTCPVHPQQIATPWCAKTSCQGQIPCCKQLGDTAVFMSRAGGRYVQVVSVAFRVPWPAVVFTLPAMYR